MACRAGSKNAGAPAEEKGGGEGRAEIVFAGLAKVQQEYNDLSGARPVVESGAELNEIPAKRSVTTLDSRSDPELDSCLAAEKPVN